MEVQGVNFAEAQINYMLGGGGHSFVVGFGSNPPLKPHHAGASCGNMPATCDWSNLYATTPNPQVLRNRQPTAATNEVKGLEKRPNTEARLAGWRKMTQLGEIC
jgi:hypothetical protein